MAITQGAPITQADLDSLATLAISKLGGLFVFGATKLATLNEIRQTLFDSGLLIPLDYAVCVSGPWVITADHHLTDTEIAGMPTVNQVVFYYAASNGAVELVTRALCANSGSPPFVALINTVPVHEDDPPVTSGHYRIVIGGNLTGDLKFDAITFVIHQTSGPPYVIPTLTTSTTIPNATFGAVTQGGPGNQDTFGLVLTVPSGATTVAPGEYTIDVACPSGYIIGTIFGGTDYAVITPTLTFDVPGQSPELAPEAVHGADDVYKIASTEPDSFADFGIFLDVATHDPDTPYDIAYTLTKRSSLQYETLPQTGGIFVGKTWTCSRVYVDDSIFGGVYDSPYGSSKMKSPAPTIAGGQINQVQPGIEFRPPRYPAFRDTEPIPSGGLWDTWAQTGWGIYSIIARCPVEKNAAGIYMPVPAVTDISIDVGHMKSGTFVKATTLTITAGQVKSDAAYIAWPIFTGTPLAYQSDSPVFLAATGCLFGFSSLLGYQDAAYPILAAHYNDLESLLNQL